MDTFLIVVAGAAFYGGITLLAALFLWLVDRWTCPRLTPEQAEEWNRQFNERLRNPNFAVVEEHFDHALPRAVKSLYQDRDEITRCDIDVAPAADADVDDRWYIAYYEPLDEQSWQHTFFDSRKYLAIANDGCGNTYIVDPRQADPEVLFHDHDDGEVSHICERLSEFLAWPRMKTEESDH